MACGDVVGAAEGVLTGDCLAYLVEMSVANKYAKSSRMSYDFLHQEQFRLLANHTCNLTCFRLYLMHKTVGLLGC